jgi:uncharacterized protein (DUF302 family)
MSTNSSRKIEVEHVVLDSAKPFAEVRKKLETTIPPLDEEVTSLLRLGMSDALRHRLEALKGFFIFLKRDHGALVGLHGVARQATQYEIGNPYTASTLTRYNLGAGLYAPLRVILYEKDGGGSCAEYDLPSSLFGQFGDDRITEEAHRGDAALARILSSALGLV